MFFCNRWRPGFGIAEVFVFLQTEVDRLSNDFLRYCTADLTYTRTVAEELYQALRTATLDGYLAAWHANDGDASIGRRARL